MKKVILICMIIELISLPLLILTVGHAGPEGSFAPVGIIPFFINLPALFLLSFLPYQPDSMLLNISLIFVIQMLIIIIIVNFFYGVFKITERKVH